MTVTGGNFSQAEICMRKSLVIRLTNARFLNILLIDYPIYDSLQETNNVHELEIILSVETHISLICYIYCERILGRDHCITAHYIKNTGHIVLRDGKYEKCIDIWHRSLDFHNGSHIANKMNISHKLLYAVYGFFHMCSEGFVPLVFLTSSKG